MVLILSLVFTFIFGVIFGTGLLDRDERPLCALSAGALYLLCLVLL